MACGPNVDQAGCSGLVQVFGLPLRRTPQLDHRMLLDGIPFSFGRRWSALQGVAHLGEGRLEVQRLVLTMGEQVVARGPAAAAHRSAG
jgi:hypothetical protein